MPQSRRKPLATKAAKRASRVLQLKKDKDEFEHLQYLQNQLDEYGNPLDLLNTDEELLNNEQKFIIRLVKILSYVDLSSITIYMYENYNEAGMSEMVDNYYSNKENKTWADSFFQITYKCLGILNLHHLLFDKVSDEIDHILDTVKQTDKPVMTDEILTNIVNELGKDLPNLSVNELINNTLLMYSQNQDYCMKGGMKCGIKGGYYPPVWMLMAIFVEDEGTPACAKCNRTIEEIDKEEGYWSLIVVMFMFFTYFLYSLRKSK
jgi:hypothetical protein